MMMGRIIYILGPEGVGKTTQANLLAHYLHKRCRTRVVNIEIRSQNLLMHVMYKMLIKFGRVEYYKYPDTVLARLDRVFLSRVINIWLLLEAIAFLLAHLVKVVLLRFVGFTVILTRHVVDFLVDMYAMGLACRRITRMHHALTYVLSRLFTYDLVIYLDAEYESLVQRYRKRRSYTEPSNWVRFYRRLSLRLLSFICNFSSRKISQRVHYIDTSQNTAIKVFAKVLKALKPTYF